MDVELFGYLLGQLRMGAAGKEHQVFAIIGPVVAQRAALAVWDRIDYPWYVAHRPDLSPGSRDATSRCLISVGWLCGLLAGHF